MENRYFKNLTGQLLELNKTINKIIESIENNNKNVNNKINKKNNMRPYQTRYLRILQCLKDNRNPMSNSEISFRSGVKLEKVATLMINLIEKKIVLSCGKKYDIYSSRIVYLYKLKDE